MSAATEALSDEKELEQKMEEANIDEEGDEDVVDPWQVKTTSEKGIDYEKLISR